MSATRGMNELLVQTVTKREAWLMITEHWLTTRMTIDKRTIGQWPILMYIHCTYETRQSCSKWSHCHACFFIIWKTGGVNRRWSKSFGDLVIAGLRRGGVRLSTQPPHWSALLAAHTRCSRFALSYNIFAACSFLVGFYQYSLITLISIQLMTIYKFTNSPLFSVHTR